MRTCERRARKHDESRHFIWRIATQTSHRSRSKPAVVREYPLASIAGGRCYPKHCLLSLSHAKSPLHHALFWRGPLILLVALRFDGAALVWWPCAVRYGNFVARSAGADTGVACLYVFSGHLSRSLWICHRGVETSVEGSNRASARRNGNSLLCRFHLFQSTTLTEALGQGLALAPVRSVLARSGILAATLRRYSAGLSFVNRRKTSRKRRSSLKPHSEATRVNVRF